MERLRAGVWTLFAASVALAAVSCVGGGRGYAPWTPDARPVPSLLGQLDGGPEEPEEAEEPEEPEELEGKVGVPAQPARDPFKSGFGLRVGFAAYPDTTKHDAAPRAAFNVYYHFKETEKRRLEGGVALFPSQAHPSSNRYLIADMRYVGYLGEAGLASWSAGGGLLFEEWYGDQDTFGYLGASIGYWLNFGQRGVDLRLSAHMPVGKDLNTLMVVAFTVGYDL